MKSGILNSISVRSALRWCYFQSVLLCFCLAALTIQKMRERRHLLCGRTALSRAYFFFVSVVYWKNIQQNKLRMNCFAYQIGLLQQVHHDKFDKLGQQILPVIIFRIP